MLVSLVVLFGASSALFGQQFNPLGGPLTGDQLFSAAALNANGGYLTWQDNSVYAGGIRIRAVRLGINMIAAGSPFSVSSAVNSKTAGDQENSQVTLLNDGGAAIVWQGGKIGAQQIFIRFLNPDGTFRTSDIRVSKFTKANQIDPRIATLGDGSVLVAWSSYGVDGSRQGVFAQHFAATGAKLGVEFQVNQFTLNNQRTPAIAALSDGGAVIAWISEAQRSPTSVDVYARIYDSSCLPVANEFRASVTTSNICANPAVAGSPGGGFALTWSQKDVVPLNLGSASGVVVSGVQTTASTNSWDVFGRVFDASAVGGPDAFRLNSYAIGDQFAPKVAAAGNKYLAVWTSLAQDGSWEGVFGQKFESDGSFDDAELPVNTTTLSRQFQPSITSDGTSHFLVTWSSFVVGGNFDFDIFARQYLP